MALLALLPALFQIPELAPIVKAALWAVGSMVFGLLINSSP